MTLSIIFNKFHMNIILIIIVTIDLQGVTEKGFMRLAEIFQKKNILLSQIAKDFTGTSIFALLLNSLEVLNYMAYFEIIIYKKSLQELLKVHPILYTYFNLN